MTKLTKLIEKYIRVRKDGYDSVSITEILNDLHSILPRPRE